MLQDKKNLKLSSRAALREKSKPRVGLSFDDVLIIPQYSKIRSRKEVNLKTKFSQRITINVPIVSANMDTVTEADMAIAMARFGGIGVIHRFNSIEEQSQEVQKVKRAENLVITDPITISKKAEFVRITKAGHKEGLPCSLNS